MAINFPLNPLHDDTHIHNGITYIYDATIPAWGDGPKDYVAPKVATIGCRVYLSASQVISTNTTTLVEFNIADWDYGNNFNSANHDFTIPAGKQGKYKVESTIRIQNTTSGHFLSLYMYVNGNQLKAIVNDHESDTGADYLSLNISNIVDVSAGDTISIKVKNTDGGSTIYGGTHSTYLSIEYLDEAPIAKIPSVTPIAFKTISSAAMTTAVQTFEEVVMAIVDYDYGTNFNESDGSYTIPVDGVYSFGSHIGIAGAATAQLQMIQSLFTSVDGAAYSEYLRGQNPVLTASYLAGYSTWSANYEGYFTKGTKVKLYVYTQSATDIYVSDNTVRPALWGHLVTGSTGIDVNTTIGIDVSMNADQASMVAATWTKALLDNVRTDIGGNWDVVNNRFVVPAGGAGRYRVSGSVKFRSSVQDDRLLARVYINGSGDGPWFSSDASGTYDGPTISRVITLAEGDYVEIWAKNDNSVDTISQYSWLDIEYLDQKVLLPFDVGTFQPTVGLTANLAPTDQALTSNTLVDVIFNSVDYDYGNNYDNTTGIFTVPKTGRYHVLSGLTFGETLVGETIDVLIEKNTAIYLDIHVSDAAQTGWQRRSVSYIDHFITGDTIKIVARNRDSSDDLVQGYTYLSIEYLDERAYNPSIVPATIVPDFQYPVFENSWVDYDTATYHEARYWKDDKGVVHLEGMIKDGTINTTVFTLPAGYRPTKRCLFVNIASGVSARLSVDADGSVDQATGTNTYVSLEGITFSTD